MNRTITATHSHVRFQHSAFDRHQSIVVDVPTLKDEFGIISQVAPARFRGAGLENDGVPVSFVPVFTPPRRRVRMHTETIVALFGGIVAVALIICSVWLMLTYKKVAVEGAAPTGTRQEARLHDEVMITKRPR